MTITEMHIRFKLGLDKLDSLSNPDLGPEIVDTILNRAQERFIKQRMSGLNTHRTGFEETQKRTDDLRVLVTNAKLTPLSTTQDNKPYGVFVALPTSPLYWFSVNEEADVLYKQCNTDAVTKIELNKDYLVLKGNVTYNSVTLSAPASFKGLSGITTFTGTGIVYEAVSKRSEVKPISHDLYNKITRDPFGKSDTDQVLRLMYGNQVELLGSDDFVIQKYYLRYIRKPIDMVYPTTDCELADHTHDEIVDIAVTMSLENIESQRYQSNLNEQRSQE
jgi:hypothetical protein